MSRTHWALLLLVLCTASAQAQELPPPVIDMHLHAGTAAGEGPPPLAMCVQGTTLPQRDSAEPWPEVFLAWLKNPQCPDPVWSPMSDDELRQETIEVLERHNIVGVLSGPPGRVGQWSAESPGRIIPGFELRLGRESISPDSLGRAYTNGAFRVLAEVTNQYAGIGPSDLAFDPYLRVAEELDIPVGVHIGTGPPGAPYLAYPFYRASLHSPLLLEEALMRHPNLRVYIMHAGWPMLDDLLAVLWTHPQVYVEVGVIDYMLPRAEFYRYLRTIVEAGFGNRVMFGSDQMVWPGVIPIAIETIQSAPFLTDSQKRDILYNNAARFLRFSDEQIERHHRTR